MLPDERINRTMRDKGYDKSPSIWIVGRTRDEKRKECWFLKET
jgi:hypothetical protein